MLPADKVLFVKVKPNSKKSELISIGKIITVSIKAPADKNKANVELLKLIRKETGCQYRIKSGMTSREKVLERV